MTAEEFREMLASANERAGFRQNAGGSERKKHGHEEDDIQTACVRWFGLEYPEIRLLLHHSPNGGKRDSRTGAMFQRMGTRAGFPDLILLVPRSGWHGLFIEMKTMAGRQSGSQKEYERLVTKQGYKYCLCRSLEGFMKIVKEYLGDGKEIHKAENR